MIYSGWKFILFLVFGGMTSNFICFTFSILRSSSLWRIATIFLSLDKAVYRPGTTSPSSRNLAPVGENSKLKRTQNHAAAKKYKVDRNSIRDWRKKRDKIEELKVERSGGAKRQRLDGGERHLNYL